MHSNPHARRALYAMGWTDATLPRAIRIDDPQRMQQVIDRALREPEMRDDAAQCAMWYQQHYGRDTR